MNTIEQSICDAIEIIVDRAVSQASYDKTIQGTVVRCQDATIGKYTIRYQDSLFYAYASSADVKYKDNATVYVLVPANDMSKQKTILGTTQKLGINYIAVAEGDQAYQYVGNNSILGPIAADPYLNDKGQFMLSSYQQNDEGDNRHVYILYQAHLSNSGNVVQDINKINLDTANLSNYLHESGSLICGAYIRTDLDTRQQQKGDYGILFRLGFYDNATQRVVVRPYVVNVDKMIGNPYKFTNAVRQYGIFSIDGANFKYVESISIFEYGFPYSKTILKNPDDYDIFFSNFQLYGANRLSEEEIATYALLLHTPRGAIFSATDVPTATRDLQAEVRVKGKTVTSQKLPYYWFVEDAGVASDSIYYCQYGGRGWKCLNKANKIKDQVKDKDGNVTEQLTYEWIPGNNTYTIAKEDVPAKETKFKCAVVYDSTVITKEIVIKNAGGTSVEIVSDAGAEFYYDTGTPTLTCKVNGVDTVTTYDDGTKRDSQYTYVWSTISNTDDFTLLVKEENARANLDANDAYNKKVKQINTLTASIANETTLKTSGEQKLNGLNVELSKLDAAARKTVIDTVDARVDLNKIEKLNVGCITDYMIFKCTVHAKDGKYIGTASIALTNSLDKKSGFTLIINNGVQSFKYSQSGVSPTSQTLVNPLTLPELNFSIYDEYGRQIDKAAAAQSDIKWEIPCKNTMLKSYNGITIEDSNNDYLTYEGSGIAYSTLVYDIKDRYNVSCKHNNIRLTVNYKGTALVTTTDFTFIKQGDPGTNGTDFVFKVEPNTRKGAAVPYYPTIFVNGNSKGVIGFNYDQIGNLSGGQWFKACLYHNNTKIWSSNSADAVYSEGKNPTSVRWNILANKYFSGTTDTSMLVLNNGNSGEFSFNSSWSKNGDRAPANIIKCQASYNGVTYYATLPVHICLVYDTDYRAQLKEYTGFNYAIYTTDGRRPSYDNSEPFTMYVTENVNGVDEDVTQTKVSGHELSYSWSLLGSIANKVGSSVYWDDSATALARNDTSISGYRYSVKPVDDYRSECVTNAVRCTISCGGSTVAEVYMPVHTMLNQYGNARLNGWDGNSVQINDDEGFILAPQVGAGKKNSDNSFSGVLIGEAKSTETGSSKNYIGILGYSHGKQSIYLDADTGNATFGIDGEGQIKLIPGGTSTIAEWQINKSSLGKKSTGGSVYLYSDNGTPSSNNPDYNRSTNPIQVAIEAKSGDGKRKVQIDYDGFIFANHGLIAGWSVTDDSFGKRGSGGNVHLYSGNAYSTNNPLYSDSRKIQLAFEAKGSGTVDIDYSGYIYADYGQVGGWYLTKDAFMDCTNGWDNKGKKITISARTGTIYSNNKNSLYSAGDGGTGGYYIGSDGIALGPGVDVFSVTSAGVLKSTRGTIGGWHIESSRLYSEGNNTYFNADGAIGHSGAWSIDSSGNAVFNNIICTQTYRLGSGNHFLNSDGSFLFKYGNLGFLSNSGFLWGNGYFNIPNGGAGNYGGWVPLSDSAGLSCGAVWVHTNGDINTPCFSCGGAGISVWESIGFGNSGIAFTKDNVIAWNNAISTADAALERANAAYDKAVAAQNAAAAAASKSSSSSGGSSSGKK